MLIQSEIRQIAEDLAHILEGRKDEILTLDKVSRMLGKSPEAIKKMCQRDRLPHHKHYGTLYFSSVELRNYILHKK